MLPLLASLSNSVQADFIYVSLTLGKVHEPGFELGALCKKKKNSLQGFYKRWRIQLICLETGREVGERGGWISKKKRSKSNKVD